MATVDEQLRQLLETFSQELSERVRSMTAQLLRLERQDGDRDEILESLFREAHSLKGAARAVHLDRIEQLTHALEEALAEARRRAQHPDGRWFDRAYAALDTIGALMAETRGERAVPDEQYQATVQGLLSAATGDELRVTGDGLRLSGDAYLSTGGRGDGRPDSAHSSPITHPSPRSSPATHHPSPVPRHPSQETIRVAVSKLDALLAQVAQLNVTKIRVEQRLQELRRLRAEIANWRREWREMRALGGKLERRRRTAPPGSEAARQLDQILGMLRSSEARLVSVDQQVELLARRLAPDINQLGTISRDLEEEIKNARLLPVATIFAPFDRMVRDLARDKHKEIRLALEGNETELDRKLLESIRDPLMHMLRNAVDHGIEPPDQRVAAGKPRSGSIRLSAEQRGGVVVIEMEDDGAGIDPDKVRAAAVAKGLLSAEQAGQLGDRQAVELIFRPGFSTAQAVSNTSGRGVGLDVVRQRLDGLNGTVDVVSRPGRGTHFIVTLPLTLATMRAVLAQLGEELYAVPTVIMERTGRARSDHLLSVEGRRAILVEGHPVPVVALASILERPAAMVGAPGILPGGVDRVSYFVLRHGERRVAFLVDRLVDEQEIVVKALAPPLVRVRNVAGATILGSGVVAMILNPADLLKSAGRSAASPAAPAAPRRAAEVPRKRILVADDSVTTRTLEKNILEAAGYVVRLARDGEEALAALAEEPVDAVLSDVDMPRMNGHELTRRIRASEAWRHLPVVLVTSLGSDDDRRRGMEAGADAYIVKSAFDQDNLLDTLRRVV